jgi:aryl-alcohol dehydrogenase-like predicted oxidoreductase
MQYQYFPGLQRDLSRLVLGTLVFDVRDPVTTNELMHAWLELGGNIVDSAHIYGDGNSERALGRWFGEQGRRDDVVVLTKGACQNVDRQRVTPEDITCDLRDSLARLQIDVIDLYVLHRDDPRLPVGPIVETLNEHKRAGRIRAFGASNWTPARLEEAIDYAAEHGLESFSCSSPQLSLAMQNEPAWPGCLSAGEASSRSWYERKRLPLFAWSSQAWGFFTGRFSSEALDDPEMVRVYYSNENWERFRRARELATQRGCTANQIALAWVLHQPFPTYPIIGPRTEEELRSSVAALEVNLSLDEVRWLNLEIEPLVAPT